MSTGSWISFAVVLLLLLGACSIISAQGTPLSDRAALGVFYAAYYQWIVQLVSHTTSLTANVIKFEWMPSPSDFVNKSGK